MTIWVLVSVRKHVITPTVLGVFLDRDGAIAAAPRGLDWRGDNAVSEAELMDDDGKTRKLFTITRHEL